MMTAQAFQGDREQVGRLGVPALFHTYLVHGEHARIGSLKKGSDADFDGFKLHSRSRGEDGQEGEMPLDPRFMEKLERGWVEQKIAPEVSAARWRHGQVKKAIAYLRADATQWRDSRALEDLDALEYYLPVVRSPRSPAVKAELMGISPCKLRDARDRGVAMVWEKVRRFW